MTARFDSIADLHGSMPEIPRVASGVSTEALALLTTEPGAVIVERWLGDEMLSHVNTEIDGWFGRNTDDGPPASGSDLYDLFLGHRTLRLHGLAHKLPYTGARLIADERLVDWASAVMAPICASVLLNAGEVIQIGAGEGAQFLHRDSDSWPALCVTQAPVVVNALIALDHFTLDNGATHVAPESHRWAVGRGAESHELRRSVMRAGDAMLFRGDLIHGGGANHTALSRRAVSISYCAGWLRPVENHAANLGLAYIGHAASPLRELLGGGVHDASSRGGGILGLVDGRTPRGDV